MTYYPHDRNNHSISQEDANKGIGRIASHHDDRQQKNQWPRNDNNYLLEANTGIDQGREC